MPARRFVGLLVALGLLGLAPAAHATDTVYVANAGAGGSVSAFAVGADGALSPVSGSPFSADNAPVAMAMTPDGGRLYTTDGDGYKGLMHVSAFSVGAGGALSPVSGSPFNAGEGPVGAAVAPDGGQLFVSDNFSNDVSAFTIGSDGALGPVAGSPFGLSDFANGVALTPDGKRLYVSGGSDDLWTFSVGANGALSPVPGSPLTIGNDPGGIGVTPDGDHLYVANYGSENVSAFSIGTDGALTPVPGSPFEAGEGPNGIAVTPDGSRLYVTNYGSGDVSGFSIGMDGALSPLPGSPYGAGTNPNGAAVTPDGSHLYVPDEGTNGVAAFSIASDGALDAVLGSPFATGNSPDAVVVTPDQGPVAAFSASAAPAGSPSAFDGSGSNAADGSVARYDWSFGDGTSAADAGPRPTHVYAAPGDYTATLTVTDAAGCSTGQTFTGQTMSCNGSSAARFFRQVTVPGSPPPSSPSPSPAPPSPPPPVALRGLKVSPARFSSTGRRVGGHCVKANAHDARLPACTRIAKLTISYTLGASATVTFKITGRLPGRKVGGRCMAQTSANRGDKPCARLITVRRSIVQHGKPGANRLILARKFAPGLYTLTATPTDGAAEHVTYKIVD